MIATHEYVVPKSIPMTEEASQLKFYDYDAIAKGRHTRSSNGLVAFLRAGGTGEEKRADEDEEEVEGGHPRRA